MTLGHRFRWTWIRTCIRPRMGLLALIFLSLGAGRVLGSVFANSTPLGRMEASWENWEVRLEESLRPRPALVSSAHVSEKLVALTIDDGPDPRFTPAVLAILRAEKVPATFFVVGQNVLDHPDLLREEYQDGNEIGNHTFSHPDLLNHDLVRAAWEISQGEQAITATIGRQPVYFRPPKGHMDREILDVAHQAGYRVVLWSVALENHDLLTPQGMADRVIRETRPGWIILMHDGRLDRTHSVEALPLIISGLRRRGYRFVTMSELLGADTRWKPKVNRIHPWPAIEPWG